MSQQDAQQNSYSGLTPDDIAALSNYPSLGKVLDNNNPQEFAKIKEKLNQTFQNFERVVLRGSREDSAKANRAAAAIKVANDFLDMVKQKF